MCPDAAASCLTASVDEEKGYGDPGDFSGIGETDQPARGRAHARGARGIRRRSGPVQAVQRHPRRSPVRLLEAAHRRPHPQRARRAREGRQGRSQARSDVRRRENQHHRETRRPAHRVAQFRRQAGPGRRQGRDARGHRHAGKDARVRRRRARGTGPGRPRSADDRRHQYRHWRLRPWPGYGDTRPGALRAPEIAQPLRLQRRRGGYSATPCAASIRRGRCSSSRRRPSQRRRR